MTVRRRIDVHQHLLPPEYVAWLRAKDIHAAGGRELPDWTVEDALRLQEEHDIATSILSVSAPGVHLGDAAIARAKAREVNEFAARIAHDHPGRLGFFATLTLPDVDGALAAPAYAFDELHASGVILLPTPPGRARGP